MAPLPAVIVVGCSRMAVLVALLGWVGRCRVRWASV
jgi:hypothetical protein